MIFPKGNSSHHLKRMGEFLQSVVKKWLKPILFTAGGALVGLAYYYFVGCSTGACPLTSNPFITMAYMGFIGWLLSGVFGKGCSGSCNMQ